MNKVNDIFKFTITYGDDINDISQYQFRFVMASTEEEALTKLLAHRTKLVSEGYSEFKIIGDQPTLALCDIIA